MIQLFHLTKQYGQSAPSLLDVTFEVDKAEFAYLTGPSGAGKSTLLRILYCAETPTSGQVLVAGRNLARLAASGIPYLRRNIGIVFQDFRLVADRTVFDNVAVALEVIGVAKRTVYSRTMDMLDRVGLAHKATSSPRQLSGGEQQRVALARALVHEPSVVLADEPTGNLDAERGEIILSILKEANVRGATVLMATHDETLIHRFPRRVIRLEHGRLAADLGGPWIARAS